MTRPLGASPKCVAPCAPPSDADNAAGVPDDAGLPTGAEVAGTEAEGVDVAGVEVTVAAGAGVEDEGGGDAAIVGGLQDVEDI